MRWIWLAAACWSVVACAGEAPPLIEDWRAGDVAPSDFALLPCAPAPLEGRCALAVAGGKKILFGTPSGAAGALDLADLASLDAVVLLSLADHDLNGLDEVRNLSWRAGRTQPLLVLGPQGTQALVAAMNRVFEASDALRVVEEGLPPGGFEAAVLLGKEPGLDGGAIFNTGDVIIAASRAWAIGVPGDVTVTYRSAHTLVLSPCADEADPVPYQGAIRLGCDPGQDDVSWPLSAPYYVFRSSG